jgi:hypothetical protein
VGTGAKGADRERWISGSFPPSVAMSVHLGIDRWCGTKAKRGRLATACCPNALLQQLK